MSDRRTLFDLTGRVACINTRRTTDGATAEGWDQTMTLNISARFSMTRALVLAMNVKEWGRIVNLASLQTTRAFPGGIPFGTDQGGHHPDDPRDGRGMVPFWHHGPCDWA